MNKATASSAATVAVPGIIVRSADITKIPRSLVKEGLVPNHVTTELNGMIGGGS